LTHTVRVAYVIVDLLWEFHSERQQQLSTCSRWHHNSLQS